MKKILIGCALASSIVLAKPYLENYSSLILTKEQKQKEIPAFTAYNLDDAIKIINDNFQTSNINLSVTTREMKNKKNDRFHFTGGSLEKLINYFNKKNIFVEKYDDVLFLKNSGKVKYQIGMYHNKKEILSLENKIKSQAHAQEIKREDFFGKTFFIVDASPYGHKIAKQIIDKDVRDQITKSKRLKIEFTKGDTKVLVAGIRLDKPMTVQRFFRDLGGQNLKTYIVKGNANIPMNENVVIYNAKGLSRYLRNVNGTTIKTHKDGKYTIVEVRAK